jgi:hypothetical protein
MVLCEKANERFNDKMRPEEAELQRMANIRGPWLCERYVLQPDDRHGPSVLTLISRNPAPILHLLIEYTSQRDEEDTVFVLTSTFR